MEFMYRKKRPARDRSNEPAGTRNKRLDYKVRARLVGTIVSKYSTPDKSHD